MQCENQIAITNSMPTSSQMCSEEYFEKNNYDSTNSNSALNTFDYAQSYCSGGGGSGGSGRVNNYNTNNNNNNLYSKMNSIYHYPQQMQQNQTPLAARHVYPSSPLSYGPYLAYESHSFASTSSYNSELTAPPSLSSLPSTSTQLMTTPIASINQNVATSSSMNWYHMPPAQSNEMINPLYMNNR